MTGREPWAHWHLVDDDVIARRLEPRPEIRCVCCGTRYLRGSFACCAPPKGMASHVWLELSCRGTGGCGKCARHCQCPTKAARLGQGPLAGLARDFLAEHGR